MQLDVKLKKVTTIFRGLRRSQIDFSKGILRCQDDQHTVTYRDQELVLSVVKKLGRFTVIDMVITALPNLIHHTYKLLDVVFCLMLHAPSNCMGQLLS